MGVQINTIEARHRFVKGAVTTGTPPAGHVACGYGTAFPMEVTLDQVAEIYYRVRNSRFTQGNITFGASPGTPIEFKVGNPSSVPSSAVPYESSAGIRVMRGYGHGWTDYGGEDLPEYNQQFFTDPTTDDYIHWRATTNNELAMYAMTDWTLGADSNFGYSFQFQTGIRYDSVSTSSSIGSINCLYCPSTCASRVRFNGEVAWIGGADIFAPGNQYYIGVYLFSLFTVMVGIYTDTDIYSFDPADSHDTGAKFRIVLSGGNHLECPIYSNWESPTVAEDIVLTASEWWPYAKSDGSPAWNSTTGGPGA